MDANSVGAQMALGTLLMDTDRREGLRHLELAVTLDPNIAQSRYQLASYLSMPPVGQYRRAADEVMKAAALDGRNLEYAFGAGQLLAYIGKHREALTYFARVRSVDPNYPTAVFLSAVSHQALGEYPDAITLFKANLRRFPADRDTHQKLSECYAKIGDPAASRRHRKLAQQN